MTCEEAKEILNKCKITVREQSGIVLNKNISVAIETILTELNKTCEYIQTEDIDYNVYRCSLCHEEWHIECGPPQDNNMHYCSQCGAKITKVIPYQYEEDD